MRSSEILELASAVNLEQSYLCTFDICAESCTKVQDAPVVKSLSTIAAPRRMTPDASEADTWARMDLPETMTCCASDIGRPRMSEVEETSRFDVPQVCT